MDRKISFISIVLLSLLFLCSMVIDVSSAEEEFEYHITHKRCLVDVMDG